MYVIKGHKKSNLELNLVLGVATIVWYLLILGVTSNLF